MSKQHNASRDPPQKKWLGIPVNWDWQNWYKGLWNPADERLFPPKRIGIGWSFNFHALLKRMRLAK